MTYTREQILSMPVGRELNEVVLSLMGNVTALGYCPNYSGAIGYAWELVKLLSKKYGVELYEEDGTSSQCILHQQGEVRIHLVSKTMEEAITKAAILAMMEQSGGTGE